MVNYFEENIVLCLEKVNLKIKEKKTKQTAYIIVIHCGRRQRVSTGKEDEERDFLYCW